MVQSVFRRELPAPAIAFSSVEGRALFREALADGTMESFFPLAEQLHTQAEPSFCGLATLVVVLNALAVDPGIVWKGPWRWYHEGALDCCKPVELIKQDGIDLDEFVCLARCQGVGASLTRADGHEGAALDNFRAAIDTHARSTGVSRALVVAYTRKGLGQTGDGHFSPIGGYHRARDLCLILDTARFKYPPHWVPVQSLWRAMSLIDESTQRPRGYVEISRPSSSICSAGEPGACFRVGLTSKRLETLRDALASGLSAHPPPPGAPDAQLAAFARALPAGMCFMVAVGPPACVGGGCADVRALAGGAERVDGCDALMRALRQTRAFEAISMALRDEHGERGVDESGACAGPSCIAECATVLALILGRTGALASLLPAEAEALWSSPLALRVPPSHRASTRAADDGLDSGLLALERELEASCVEIASVVKCADAHANGSACCAEPVKQARPQL
ncbi:hypothetical protein KFE25_007059 [Diacronema lutheri]|uniref:glutathione gamma-glutamylcysteinyltransferase n=1 Tax=Diacronema lutheri TaxID=2081491 RepID=A0A8J6CAU1_DIALT|nr:hypothetical protein KFE25_007059 [Diacronema lutheri]